MNDLLLKLIFHKCVFKEDSVPALPICFFKTIYSNWENRQYIYLGSYEEIQKSIGNILIQILGKNKEEREIVKVLLYMFKNWVSCSFSAPYILNNMSVAKLWFWAQQTLQQKGHSAEIIVF